LRVEVSGLRIDGLGQDEEEEGASVGEERGACFRIWGYLGSGLTSTLKLSTLYHKH